MAIRAVHRNPIRSVARSFFLGLGKIKRFIIDLLTATSTRNSQTTCIGIASDGTFDNPVLLTVPANLVAIVGGRLDGTTWYNTDVNGIHLDTALQNYGAGTNYLWPSQAPATMTTVSLTTGFYTLSVYGAGSALASGGTATIVGAAAATEGSPNTIEVTVAGTVTVTVTGALDRFQLEGGLIETAHIITTVAPVTRNADVTTVPTPSVLTGPQGAVEIHGTSPLIQNATFLLATGVPDSGDETYLRIDTNIFVYRKIVGTVVNQILPAHTIANGDDFGVRIAWDDVDGMFIQWNKNDGAWSTPETIPNTDNATINGTLSIGNRGGITQSVGDYANDGVPIAYASKEAAGW